MARGRAPGGVRIIGGQWRRATIRFPADQNIRPSPDRIRETLFNWLDPVLPGARCLDVFAGSGVLGLEAASRGALAVTLNDVNPVICAHLRTQCERFSAHPVSVSCADAQTLLAQKPDQPFDVVFLDPPFGSGELDACVQLLENGGWLASRAWIYLETPSRVELPQLPPGWRIERGKRAGQVRYYLAARGD